MAGIISTGILRASELSKSVAGGAGTTTLTADESRNGTIIATGTLTDNRNMAIPDLEAPAGTLWLIENGTTATGGQLLTVKTVSGTGVVVANGTRALLRSDGTNIEYALTDLAALATGVGDKESAGFRSSTGYTQVIGATDADINTLLEVDYAIIGVDTTGGVRYLVRLPNAGDGIQLGRHWLVYNEDPNQDVQVSVDGQADPPVSIAPDLAEWVFVDGGTQLRSAGRMAYIEAPLDNANIDYRTGIPIHRAQFIRLTTGSGAATAVRDVIVPATPGMVYWVQNQVTSSGGPFAHLVKTPSGTGINVPETKIHGLICDGTNIISFAGPIP